MAVSLQKGQKIDLTKGNANLKKVLVGLGWDPIRTSGTNFDIDSSVLMLDENGKIAKSGGLFGMGGAKMVVSFRNLKSPCGSVVHGGDNLTGDGDGDDEQIYVDLTKVPSNIQKLVFVVNIYMCESRSQDFGQVLNAYIRLANHTDQTELCRFNLSDNYSGKTALIVGEIYRHSGEWKFNAIGEGTTDRSISDLEDRY
ncbi:TerD family protein [Brevibacillus nitrificans]|uniref:TerD family protein n=1 Tax=Brevibacillus nitrificans TaxID=651560 RepID=UPI002855E66B|nr:TerD family protein [Brevibacillus nitrificans]MDR7318027.1 stress response protein SCP2 [Brevibacillus nitrificans]